MKLTYEDTVQNMNWRKQGEGFKRLFKSIWVLNVSGLKYMVKSIDRLRIDPLKSPNQMVQLL